MARDSTLHDSGLHIQGQIYHRVGALLPVNKDSHQYLRVYYISSGDDQGDKPKSQISRSDLDPNQKRKNNSENSLSGDDFDQTRKRMRSNNKTLKHTGRTSDVKAPEGSSPIDTSKPVQLDHNRKREAPGSAQAGDSAQAQKAATSKLHSSPTPFYYIN